VGNSFGGKEEAKLYEDQEPTGEDLVDYVGYLGHVEDPIVTELIEVAEEPVTKVVKENGDSYSNNKEVNEKGKWVLVEKKSGRESGAIMS